MSSQPLVEIRDVWKSFAEGDAVHAVLRGASADVRRGELVVLVGPSGSGKSTLLNLMSGIDAPDRGTIEVGGADLTTLDERARTLFRRRSIGFVFQFFNLLPTLSVVENVLLPLELNGVEADAARTRARELLDEVGLAQRSASSPDRLSGGEQQRVAIARAIAHDPLLLLADEPTGNLDATSGRDVLALLDRVTRGAGRTMVVVTHSAEVVAIADRVLTLRDGRIAES